MISLARRIGRGWLLAGGLLVLSLAACSSSFNPIGFGVPQADIGAPAGPALGSGQQFGTGPVRVALLLPLTGDPALASVGISLANGSRLAMDFIAANDKIADNITIYLKDTGPSAAGAAQAASEAVREGASLILGPLKADQVQAAGSVARTAGISLIAFSNNSAVAAPGVYLLNVLPETEVRRSVGYAGGLGKRAFAGIFPTSDYGQIQQAAFRQATAGLGGARAVYSFSSDSEARLVAKQIAPALLAGQIDALFLPDRASAPRFATLLAEAGVPQGKVQIIGSADWNGDPAIAGAPFLVDALYPAVDDAGYQALAAEYGAKYAGRPHPLVTISYTATILANVSTLSMSTPKYDRAQLTLPSGFKGRDGVFRFLPDGRSEYALVIKKVTAGGASTVDGPKL